MGAMQTYRSALRRALVAQQARLWAVIERRMEGRLRTDAAADGSALREETIQFSVGVLDTVGRRVAKKVADETKRIVGIARVTSGADGAMVDAFRRRNLGLIKSLESEQVAELEGILDEATTGGWHIRELRNLVEERFKVARSKADLIARDQTLKLNAQLAQHRQTSAGIRSYIWSTSNDERVREEHAALDGETIRWDSPPASGPNGENWHPGEGYQCRCVPLAVVPWLSEGEGDDDQAE
jgi:SPP1 gp7 family putative phage head morphogenesis protein